MKHFILPVLFLHHICFAQGIKSTDTSFTEPGHLLTITYKTNNFRDSIVYSKTEEKGKAVFIFKANGTSGTWILYTKEGYKGAEYNVDNDRKNGVSVEFYKNGSILRKEFFFNGFKEGKSTLYYENGNVKHVAEYIHNKLDGENKSYYKNGNLQWKGNYAKGKMNGERIYFDEKGNFINSDFTFYRDNGKIEREGKCIAGKPQGELKLYDSDGLLLLVVNFREGKPDGAAFHYKNEKLISTEIYRKGKFKKEMKFGKKK